MSEDMPEIMSERISYEKMSADMPGRMSEVMPEKMSEDMPDRMTETMPACQKRCQKYIYI